MKNIRENLEVVLSRYNLGILSEGESVMVLAVGIWNYGENSSMNQAKVMAKALFESETNTGPSSAKTTYASEVTKKSLWDARGDWKRGDKISAIKTLRQVYEPKLGLKEAKELLENLCDNQ